MARFFACLIGCSFAATAWGAANLLQNPSFETDANAPGVPDHWRSAGDGRLVAQTLALDKGRDGRRCARLACTRFQRGNAASHAMLCQMSVPVRRGKCYRVAFWARAEKIDCDMVSIALSDTSAWDNCGLNEAFVPTADWQRYEFIFRANRDCPTKSRFQIWFYSTGTLWLDDVQFEEAGPDLYRPGHIIPAAGYKNLVPNASFECGIDGWGSADWDRPMHWSGRMNRLFGTLDTSQAWHGRCSLRIELSPENQPVCYFDWYELRRMPIRAPLAANIGFIEVEPGREYTLSVCMKAGAADTPARLAVRQFQRGSFEKSVLAATDWRRYTLEFKPTARWCYVLAGPDLCKTKENQNPPDRAVLWLDAVALERADAPSAFATRQPVEFGIQTGKPGNVFGWDEPLRLNLLLSNSMPNENRKAKIELRLTDFFDEEVWRESVQANVPADARIQRKLTIRPKPELRGFLRLHAKMTSGDVQVGRTMRLAVIPICRDANSRFGVNHAYPWPHLLDLCRKAGLVWVRDWSLKWHQVEPEKGRFTFVETDYQIDRPLRHDLRVLGLLPFPSSHWSSTASPEVKSADRFGGSSHAPRDVAEFEDYVQHTVAHYKGRITWWQVFNEPLFTHYSLPRKYGYDGATYARLTKAFARAARRADPNCRILAGIGYLREGGILDDFDKFFAAGGLEVIDAVDIHHYPRIRPPEFIEGPLEKLNALMEKHGGRKPIWLTEYGYYADDEPWAIPMPRNNFSTPLSSERRQAEYAVRWATIMLANGVDKIFYHAGTCDGINNDSLQGIFYEYAGTPHKIYAAQAVLARMFTPSTKFVKQLSLGERVKGYLFRDGRRRLGIVWAAGGIKAAEIRLADEKLQLHDMMGRPQTVRKFVPSGTPVFIISEGLSDEQFQARLKMAE